MTIKPFVFFLVVLAGFGLAPLARSQELDGSELQRQLIQREERVGKLSIEDQLKLRAAQQKAAEDPAVKAAMEKRDRAIEEFRTAVRASMIKADPTVQAILERVAIPPRKP